MYWTQETSEAQSSGVLDLIDDMACATWQGVMWGHVSPRFNTF
jgi:hypothetical protein